MSLLIYVPITPIDVYPSKAKDEVRNSTDLCSFALIATSLTVTFLAIIKALKLEFIYL